MSIVSNSGRGVWALRGILIAGGLGAVSFMGAIAAASAAEPQRGALSACTTDLATFCPGIEAGGGKKMRCLMDNQAKLSPACATSVQARVQSRAARLGGTDVAQAQTPPLIVNPDKPAKVVPPFVPAGPAAGGKANMRACRTDVATLCGSVEKGGGARVKCLMDNQAKLSPDCAAAVATAQSNRQAAKTVCEADAAKLCGAARGPARRQCLETNKAQLSPACAAQVDRRAANEAKRAAVPKQ